MGGELIVEPYCSVVDALPAAAAISFRSSVMRRSRMIFVASDKSLGGGEAVVSGGLRVTVFKEVTGSLPLFFALFLLFSLGELGITRGVICGSLGLVSSSSPGLVICCSLGGAMDSAVWTGDCSSRTAMQESRS